MTDWEKTLRSAPLFILLGLLAAASAGSAGASPLPPAGEVALNAFFDGCLQPVSARKDPGPPMVQALAPYRPDEAPKPDAQHPERRLWRVRALDGDLEFETFTGAAWCEIRVLGADPAQTARRLDAALVKLDVPMQRKSLAAAEPGESGEVVLLGHDSGDALMITLRQRRDPRDGEAGVVISLSPVRLPAARP
jgi:hypothetical protein